MKKVIMINDKNFGADYSVEAGKSDGAKHFDHHGQFAGHIAPCRAEMPVAENGETIQISHIDADTFVGLLKLYGADLPEVDFELMEQIDLNGTSVCADKFNPTLLYMVGVGEVARNVKFPRATDQEQDVTDIVEAMMAKTEEEIIETGRNATEASEATYRDCKVTNRGNVGFWKINANQPFDPSRPYEDGISVVVVYRENYRSVSVYCDPNSSHTTMTLGKVETGDGLPQNYRATIGGYRMCGHPKATGTERTTNGWSFEDAQAIYDAIVG
jgi:hypothetical protein